MAYATTGEELHRAWQHHCLPWLLLLLGLSGHGPRLTCAGTTSGSRHQDATYRGGQGTSDLRPPKLSPSALAEATGASAASASASASASGRASASESESP